MDSEEHIDYLVVGHICHDLTIDGMVTGGSAAYSGSTAQVMGCRTAIVTSSAPGNDWHTVLPGVSIHLKPSAKTTVFENVYEPTGRIQTIHAVADKIRSKDIPAAWQRASIVHLAPIANEVDPDIIHLFSNSLVGLTPQGWMRHWDDQGHVSAREWTAAKTYLRLAAAVIISDEDLLSREMLDQFREWSRLLVMTRGSGGCTVFLGEDVRHFSAPPGKVVDTTGAGDIFAAAFLVRMFQTGGNPSEAARVANEVATMSISANGLKAKMKKLREHVTNN